MDININKFLEQDFVNIKIIIKGLVFTHTYTR